MILNKSVSTKVLLILAAIVVYKRKYFLKSTADKGAQLKVVIERISKSRPETNDGKVKLISPRQAERVYFGNSHGDGSTVQTTSSKEARYTWDEKFVDHPIVAWVLENGSVAISCWLALKLESSVSHKDNFKFVAWRLFIKGVVLMELMTGFQHILVNQVYAHRPFFSEKRPRQTLVQVLWDWLQCNAIVSAGAAIVQASLSKASKPHDFVKVRTKRFHIPSFLCKLLLVRVVGDIVFYAGHRLLHENKFLYKYVHKRHHEHNRTALITNYHFSAADLAIEGFAPLTAGLMVLYFGLGIHSSAAEMTALGAYYNWYEVASHSGKEMPTATTFPPLSPLLTYFKAPVDDRNIEFHEKHHNVLKCNYGITPWIDKLLGTAKYGLAN